MTEDEAIESARMCDESKAIPLKIIGQLDYGIQNKIILEDADINAVIQELSQKAPKNRICARVQNITKKRMQTKTTTRKSKPSSPASETSTSMVGVFSGHGNDLDRATRSTIVDAIMGLQFSFPQLKDDGTDDKKSKIKKTSYQDILVPALYKKESAFRTAFEKYITDSVYLQIAMSEPGPSAPMSLAEDQSALTKAFGSCLNESDIDLKEFSSSEVDIYIVANAYWLLYKKLQRPPSDCDLIEFNRVIRHMLRANFIYIWDEELKEQKGQDLWKKHYLKLVKDTIKNIQNPKIWVLKTLNKFSYDRYYQLKPNQGEDPNYRVHEGFHIFDFRDANGNEVVNAQGQTIVDFSNWKITMQREGAKARNDLLDTNNLKNPDFRKRFFDYVKNRFPITGVPPTVSTGNKAIRTAIRGILYSIEHDELYLSEICLLGFLLEIQMLSLYDPACRPFTHTVTTDKGKEIISTTRSGKVREGVDDVYGALDSYLEENTQREIY